MGEFFNGWRRKTGCVLLIAASAVATLMLRSQMQGDQIIFPLWKCGHKIDTGNGHFSWLCRWLPNGDDIGWLYSRNWKTYPIDRTYTSVGDSLLERFGFYWNLDRSIGILEVVIPYWFVIVFFSFIAVCLICRKPPKDARTENLTSEKSPT